jgi:hypothetical protein
MSDFEAALRDRLARNSELAKQRAEAEQLMVQAERDAEERARREEEQRRQARSERHAELVESLTAAARHLKAADPEGFIVRLGWTESREEFIAKISSRLLYPSRSLFVELDRDDDEVLVRWHSDVGNALELWRLLDVGPELMQELVLQVADQELWRGRDNPPPFPGARGFHP